MKQRIVLQKPDGSILVVTPAGETIDGETETEYLDRIAARTLAAVPSFAGCVRLADVALADIPGRRFRAAWRQAGGGIGVDLPSARSIVMADMRAERNRRLAETDAEKNRLDDVGTSQEKQALRVRRQALRDLPVVVAAEIAAMTADQMELHTPTWPV
jgi:hypothetical protein